MTRLIEFICYDFIMISMKSTPPTKPDGIAADEMIFCDDIHGDARRSAPSCPVWAPLSARPSRQLPAISSNLQSTITLFAGRQCTPCEHRYWSRSLAVHSHAMRLFAQVAPDAHVSLALPFAL